MKRPWSDFSDVNSTMPGARDAAHDLVRMADYRKAERMTACGGADPITIILAYAQDELAYDENEKLYTPSPEIYHALPREKRLNKFGLAYRRDAQFWQHRVLADIVVGAAIHLYHTQGWTTVLYDGLRTVEGAYNLYQFATDADIAAGLLALPGYSAHNKGLAVDSMMQDRSGIEIDMGGHFDHLDMTTNSRVYDGDKISPAAKQNRLIREAAFLRSAFTQGLLIAPLRSEFWDDRPPESREDLWRVLDSAARVMGITLMTPEDAALRKTNPEAFHAKWESWSYEDFLNRWADLFKGRDSELLETFGITTPPLVERFEFYHGNYHPIYDRDLRPIGQHLTDSIIAL